MPVRNDEEKKKPVTLAGFNEQAGNSAIKTIGASDFVVGALKARPVDPLKIVAACGLFGDQAMEFQQNLLDLSSAMSKVDPKSLDSKTAAQISSTMGILRTTADLIPVTADACEKVLTIIGQEPNNAPSPQKPAASTSGMHI